MNPKYPVYIPSKGRWDTRWTSKVLERIGVPYHIVIEPSEYDKYACVISREKILVLPKDNMKLIGSRCWIMEHSIKLGFERHWQIDDNISSFFRVNNNLQVKVSSGTIFKIMEDFVDRYENIAYAGPQYDFFLDTKSINPPFILNTRIYSCTLVNNSIPYRWRSIYNDDTDVSICALKDGWCTVLFNAFLQEKEETMKMKGGNTEELYLIQDGRKKMAEALIALHPDVTTMTYKFGKWQHQVNYAPFKKNKLIKKSNIHIPQGINNYGMVLKEIENGNSR